MSSAVDIQIVSSSNLEKIENFFKDSTYRETIEFSANFNTRLCIERRLRLPFLDPQTGVAQNHSNLFVNKRQRMPGFRQGQIYTYPAQRWRKSRRQYLNKMYRFPVRQFEELLTDHDAILASTGTASPIVGTAAPGSFLDPDFNGSLLEESSSLGAFGGDTSDSKDSQQQPQMQQQHQLQQHQHQQHNLKEDQLSKDWFYDDLDINDADSLEEPKSPADDEYDYDPRYGSKKRRKPRIGKRAMVIPGEGGTGRRRTGSGRGRANAVAIASSALSIADTSLTGSDVIDGGCGMLAMADASTPTTSGGKRSRGSRTRGRRRTKATSSTNRYPPGPNTEPPTFEMAAASVGVTSDFTCGSPDELSGLRNYRKYV